MSSFCWPLKIFVKTLRFIPFILWREVFENQFGRIFYFSCSRATYLLSFLTIRSKQIYHCRFITIRNCILFVYSKVTNAQKLLEGTENKDYGSRRCVFRPTLQSCAPCRYCQSQMRSQLKQLEIDAGIKILPMIRYLVIEKCYILPLVRQRGARRLMTWWPHFYW